MIERELTDFLIAAATGAAVTAGRKIMEIYNDDGIIEASLNSNNTIITKAGRLSHESIKSSLAPTRIPVMSEEGRNILYEERFRWDLYWLVDPLDGTREFVAHNPEFVVSIALMVENKPLFGVIYIPAEERLFFSDPDRGAFVMNNPICFADASTPPSVNRIFSDARRLVRQPWEPSKPLRVAITRSHINRDTEHFVNLIKKRYPHNEIIECGSSKKFCLIAEDKADVYVRLTGMLDWDVAAGHAITEAVGAKTHHIDGNPIVYNDASLEIPPFITRYDAMQYDYDIVSLDGFAPYGNGGPSLSNAGL